MFNGTSGVKTGSKDCVKPAETNYAITLCDGPGAGLEGPVRNRRILDTKSETVGQSGGLAAKRRWFVPAPHMPPSLHPYRRNAFLTGTVHRHVSHDLLGSWVADNAVRVVRNPQPQQQPRASLQTGTMVFPRYLERAPSVLDDFSLWCSSRSRHIR